MAAPGNWQGRRVLVTGCTGLLGTAVVRELLAREATVVGLVRDRIPDGDYQRDARFRQVHLVHGRVEDRFRIQSALAVHEVRHVFHLTGPTDGSNPDRGTAAVLAAIQGHDSRITLTTARPAPLLGLAGANTHEPLKSLMPWGVAEFGELFGGGDRKTFRVVPGTIVSLLLGDRTPPAFEPGSARDFLHVEDAARGCLAVAESLTSSSGPQQQVMPIRSGWVFTDRDMAAAVRTVFAGGTLTPATAADANWRPTHSLNDRLQATIAWYRDFLRQRFFGTRPAAPPHRAAA